MDWILCLLVPFCGYKKMALGLDSQKEDNSTLDVGRSI
jgi:hypothetical protein